MKIDRHISELLYDHDCVIVPAFGGFLVSYLSSQHQAIQHTFYPPSKKIAFNVFLKNNDGLLANFVAQRENIAYSDALKGIEDFRLHAMKLLESGQHIDIEDVGTLYYDKQKNLQFEPAKHINYLQEAFGLAAVQSPPVKREEQRKRIERQIRKAVAIRDSVKPSRTKPVWKVFNTVTLSGALLWFAFNIYLVTPHRGNISSLNPFSYSSSEKVDSKSSPPSSSISVQKADSIDHSLPNNQPVADNADTKKAAPPAIEPVAPIETTVQPEKHFFVIAGVFHEPGNAEKLVAGLKQDGFTDAQIINPESSVKKVCYNGFASHKEAAEALAQIHSSKKEGWILQK